MYIKSLLQYDAYEPLRAQYLSFVQVGGAYAFNYKPIIEFLGLKAIVISDLDYTKNALDVKTILESQTTNATINAFANLVKVEKIQQLKCCMIGNPMRSP